MALGLPGAAYSLLDVNVGRTFLLGGRVQGTGSAAARAPTSSTALGGAGYRVQGGGPSALGGASSAPSAAGGAALYPAPSAAGRLAAAAAHVSAPPCTLHPPHAHHHQAGGSQGRAWHRRQASVDQGSVCMHVGISIPAERASAFRALLARLKKRAFRLESPLVRWA